LSEIASLIGAVDDELKDKLELLKIPEGMLKKLQEEARKQEQSLPIVMSFVLNKSQEKIVARAFEKNKEKSKAEKLEAVCSAYLKEKDKK
jgi:hypothetical protein